MAGIHNGTLQESLYAQTKQFGPVLRGLGPPAPQAGVVGDLYIDTQTWLLYGKRSNEGVDPWGNYLFPVPADYQSGLKWFSAYLPGNDIGVDDDYCLLWGGFNNYGTQPSIFGPKVDGCWPESGDGPIVLLDPSYAGFELPVGVSDEGTVVAYSSSTQLVVAGLSDEYILAIPIVQLPNSPTTEVGLQSAPDAVAVDLNPLYNATNEHAV